MVSGKARNEWESIQKSCLRRYLRTESWNKMVCNDKTTIYCISPLLSLHSVSSWCPGYMWHSPMIIARLMGSSSYILLRSHNSDWLSKRMVNWKTRFCEVARSDGWNGMNLNFNQIFKSMNQMVVKQSCFYLFEKHSHNVKREGLGIQSLYSQQWFNPKSNTVNFLSKPKEQTAIATWSHNQKI